MAKRKSLDEQLANVSALRGQPVTAEVVAALREGLRSRSPHVSAKAATVAGESEASGLVEELIAAFERWSAANGASDKGCVAKTAIAEAVYRLGVETPAGEEVFLRGVRHVQMEPVFGGRVDTAVDLRGHSAMGLVRMNHADAMLHLAELLADPEPGARAAAARAMAYRGGEDAAPLLRYKLAAGDTSPEVLGECVLTLVHLLPRVGFAVAGDLLNSAHRQVDDEARESIALALGQTRRSEALGLLAGWWERTLDAELRRTALTAIATLRLDAARDFLLGVVSDGDQAGASDAVRALAIFRYDPALAQRVRQAVEERRDEALVAKFREAFDV